MNCARSLVAGRSHEVCAYLLFFALGIFSFAFMSSVPLSGDEVFYVAGSRALANALISLVRGHGVDLTKLVDLLVGNGWFMPGMAFLLFPISLLFGGSLVAVRASMLVLNLSLLFAIFRQISPRYPPRVPLLFLVALFASPYYIACLSTAWSDLPGVHLAILFCLWIEVGRSNRPAPSLLAGALIAMITYVRALYPPLLAVASLSWLIPSLKKSAPAGVAFRDWLGRTTAAALIFLVTLLPWSLAVTQRFGTTFTVTTMPLSQIVMFSDQAFIEHVEQDTGQRQISFVALQKYFVALQTYISNRAVQQGHSFMTQAWIERDALLGTVPWSERFYFIARSVRPFFLRPNEFFQRFLDMRCQAEHCVPAWLANALRFGNTAGWTVLALIGALIVLLPMSEKDGIYFLPFQWKAVAFLVCMHPVFLIAHGRYYSQLVPLFALGIALFASGQWRLYRLRTNCALHDILIGFGQFLAAVTVVALGALIVPW
jgi:hypothetical protein